MRNQSRYLRLPWVALAAMVGMLWGVADVSACTTYKAPKSCCCCAVEKPASSECCTTTGYGLDESIPSHDRIPGTSFRGIRPPCGPCVCSPTSPANQGERRQTRTTEESFSEAFLDSLHISHSSLPPRAPSPVTQTDPCTSRTPLYLRVERLII